VPFDFREIATHAGGHGGALDKAGDLLVASIEIGK